MDRKEKILRYEEEIQKKEEARKEYDARCEERIKQLRGMISKEKALLKKEEDVRIAAAIRAAATDGEDIDSLLARLLGSKSSGRYEPAEDEVIDYNETFGDMPQEYLEVPSGEQMKESDGVSQEGFWDGD